MYPVDENVALPRLTPEEDLQAALAAAGGGTQPLHNEGLQPREQ